MGKISFISSDDRKYNVSRTLSLIKSDIVTGIKVAKRVVVVPNCYFDEQNLASTHVDALDAVLEFISPYVADQIILVGGASKGETLDAFERFHYFQLRDKYDLAIVDANYDDEITLELTDNRGRAWPVSISKTVAESDYLISVCPPKTHPQAYYAGIIENVCLESLTRQKRSIVSLSKPSNFKDLFYKNYNAIAENIDKLHQQLSVRLAVLDGFSALHGDAPQNGQLAASHWCISSTEVLAVDYLALQLLDLDIADIPYLDLIAKSQNFSDNIVVGDDWQKHVTHAKAHRNFQN